MPTAGQLLESLLAKGVEYLEAQRYDEALQVFCNAEPKAGGGRGAAKVHALQGDACVGLKDPRRAEEYYLKAVGALLPQSAVVAGVTARRALSSLSLLKSARHAQTDLELLLDLYTSMGFCSYTRGAALSAVASARYAALDEAARWYQLILDSGAAPGPRAAAAQSQGGVFMKMGRWAAAAAAFKLAAALASDGGADAVQHQQLVAAAERKLAAFNEHRAAGSITGALRRAAKQAKAARAARALQRCGRGAAGRRGCLPRRYSSPDLRAQTPEFPREEAEKLGWGERDLRSAEQAAACDRLELAEQWGRGEVAEHWEDVLAARFAAFEEGAARRALLDSLQQERAAVNALTHELLAEVEGRLAQQLHAETGAGGTDVLDSSQVRSLEDAVAVLKGKLAASAAELDEALRELDATKGALFCAQTGAASLRKAHIRDAEDRAARHAALQKALRDAEADADDREHALLRELDDVQAMLFLTHEAAAAERRARATEDEDRQEALAQREAALQKALRDAEDDVSICEAAAQEREHALLCELDDAQAEAFRAREAAASMRKVAVVESDNRGDGGAGALRRALRDAEDDASMCEAAAQEREHALLCELDDAQAAAFRARETASSMRKSSAVMHGDQSDASDGAHSGLRRALRDARDDMSLCEAAADQREHALLCQLDEAQAEMFRAREAAAAERRARAIEDEDRQEALAQREAALQKALRDAEDDVSICEAAAQEREHALLCELDDAQAAAFRARETAASMRKAQAVVAEDAGKAPSPPAGQPSPEGVRRRKHAGWVTREAERAAKKARLEEKFKLGARRRLGPVAASRSAPPPDWGASPSPPLSSPLHPVGVTVYSTRRSSFSLPTVLALTPRPPRAPMVPTKHTATHR